MQFITFISFIVLASSSGWTPSCISDEAEFDFYVTRPQKFAFGTPDEVAQAYERLVDNIGKLRLLAA